MINFPIKGKGLRVAGGTYSNGDTYYDLVASNSLVTHLSLLDTTDKRTQAQCIADLIQKAAAIGFEQGVDSIRIALGVSK